MTCCGFASVKGKIPSAGIVIVMRTLNAYPVVLYTHHPTPARLQLYSARGQAVAGRETTQSCADTTSRHARSSLPLPRALQLFRANVPSAGTSVKRIKKIRPCRRDLHEQNRLPSAIPRHCARHLSAPDETARRTLAFDAAETPVCRQQRRPQAPVENKSTGDQYRKRVILQQSYPSPHQSPLIQARTRRGPSFRTIFKFCIGPAWARIIRAERGADHIVATFWTITPGSVQCGRHSARDLAVKTKGIQRW